MYYQLVDNQVLSTQGQPDGGVNLHRLTDDNHLLGDLLEVERARGVAALQAQTKPGLKVESEFLFIRCEPLKPGGAFEPGSLFAPP